MNTLLPLAVMVPIVLLMMGICWTIAKVSGWRALHRQYGGAWTVPKGKHMLNGKVGNVDYHNLLFVSHDEVGLYLGVFPLIRFAHPTLFIPWQEFHRIRPSRHVLLDHVVATIGEPRITTLRLPRRSVKGTVLDPATKVGTPSRLGEV